MSASLTGITRQGLRTFGLKARKGTKLRHRSGDSRMQIYHGKSVFGGIAVGKIQIFSKTERRILKTDVSDTKTECERFECARKEAIAQLSVLYERATEKVGKENAAIFSAHQMILEDKEYIDSVNYIINAEGVNAEYAVHVTADNYSAVFLAIDDDYMRQRAADIRDVSERLTSVLSGNKTELSSLSEPVLIFAEDLAPSETVQMDKEKILAFVTAGGSVNSHTAILARTMGIPAIVDAGIDLRADMDGKEAIVDGYDGTVYIEPDEMVRAGLLKRKAEEEKKKALLLELKGKEDVTLDGRHVSLYANIGSLDDLDMVFENDAGGIGLFRSEFIYLNSMDYPDEEEQFKIYRSVAEAMEGKRVIIRTLDIGADKQADYFHIPKEENPALGYRAIRICLSQPEIFKTQLRAILRASAYGNIAVMYPMITSVWEVRRVKEIMEEVKGELRAQKITFGNVPQGIMIETPAAVMVSRELAKKVDFFSIGTNDLTQYTLAVDRQNPELDAFYDPHHPAVLAMIRMVVENAHAEGIWAGICGELGADLSLTKEFLKMGVDELSVSPGRVLPIRKVIVESSCS